MTTTDTNPIATRMADAALAFAIAVVDDTPGKEGAQSGFQNALVELTWTLGVTGEDEANLLAEVLALTTGKALAHGTHKRGAR
jgi:hypothetical protein